MISIKLIHTVASIIFPFLDVKWECSIDFEPKTVAEPDSFHLFLTQEARLKNIFSWSS
jgi:hypothetical protein